MRKEASFFLVCSGCPISFISDVANHYPFSCRAVNNMTHVFIFSPSSQRGNSVECVVSVISYTFALFLCLRRQRNASCKWNMRLSIVFKLLGVLFAFWDWPVGKPCLTWRNITWCLCWARGTQAVSLCAFSLGLRPQITKNIKALNTEFNAKTSVKWEEMFDMILFYAAVCHKMLFPKPSFEE